VNDIPGNEATMRIALWLAAMLLVVDTAAAQDRIYKLEPRKVSDIAQGKAVLINGETGTGSHRFLIDQLTVYTPIVVTLRPVRKGDDVRLKIGKTSWEEALRNGSGKDGQVSFKFRTEGEMLISVDGDKPKLPYKLLVWVGDEVQVDPPPAVLPKSKLKTVDAPGLPGGIVLWVIAATLIGIFILLFRLVARKKS
jgi:hypothetical protein